MAGKNRLVPESLLVDTYRLLDMLTGENITDECREACRRLEAALESKVDAIKRHDTFTKYKTASVGSDQRELSRNEYLNMTGIPKDYRSTKETHL